MCFCYHNQTPYSIKYIKYFPEKERVLWWDVQFSKGLAQLHRTRSINFLLHSTKLKIIQKPPQLHFSIYFCSCPLFPVFLFFGFPPSFVFSLYFFCLFLLLFFFFLLFSCLASPPFFLFPFVLPRLRALPCGLTPSYREQVSDRIPLLLAFKHSSVAAPIGADWGRAVGTAPLAAAGMQCALLNVSFLGDISQFSS